MRVYTLSSCGVINYYAGIPAIGPKELMEDNQGAVHIARNPVVQARTKHIDICYHYIREALIDGTIDLRHCPTQDMIADIFTNPHTYVG